MLRAGSRDGAGRRSRRLAARRRQVLIFGASQPIRGEGRSVKQIAGLVRRGRLESMDGRDAARTRAVAELCGAEVYTVSKQRGAEYGPRHLNADFNSWRIVKSMLDSWGEREKPQFRHVYLDYYWNPDGTWAGEHWKRSFVRDNLPRLVTEGLLDFGDWRRDVEFVPELEAHMSGAGVVYLPFCERTLTLVVANYDKLSPHFTISFLHKDKLDEHMLWKATNASISPEMMRDTFEKEIDQEELYCTLDADKIRNGLGDDSVRKEKVEGVRSRIDRPDDVRMIKLTALRMWDPDCPESLWKGKDEVGLDIGGFVGLRPAPSTAVPRKRRLPQREAARPDEEGPRRKRARKNDRPLGELGNVVHEDAACNEKGIPEDGKTARNPSQSTRRDNARSRRTTDTLATIGADAFERFVREGVVKRYFDPSQGLRAVEVFLVSAAREMVARMGCAIDLRGSLRSVLHAASKAARSGRQEGLEHLNLVLFMCNVRAAIGISQVNAVALLATKTGVTVDQVLEELAPFLPKNSDDGKEELVEYTVAEVLDTCLVPAVIAGSEKAREMVRRLRDRFSCNFHSGPFKVVEETLLTELVSNDAIDEMKRSLADRSAAKAAKEGSFYAEPGAKGKVTPGSLPRKQRVFLMLLAPALAASSVDKEKAKRAQALAIIYGDQSTVAASARKLLDG